MGDPHGGEDLGELGVDGVVHQPVEAVPNQSAYAQQPLDGRSKQCA